MRRERYRCPGRVIQLPAQAAATGAGTSASNGADLAASSQRYARPMRPMRRQGFRNALVSLATSASATPDVLPAALVPTNLRTLASADPIQPFVAGEDAVTPAAPTSCGWASH